MLHSMESVLKKIAMAPDGEAQTKYQKMLPVTGAPLSPQLIAANLNMALLKWGLDFLGCL